MLTLLQCRKLGRVYSCLYFSEAELKLRDKRVINVRVKRWHPTQSDIFNENGTLDRKELERISLKVSDASVLFEKEYYADDEYDEETDELIKKGEKITDEHEIINLDQNRFTRDDDWHVITAEEIEELYKQANF